jgi:hypothetical protein
VLVIRLDRAVGLYGFPLYGAQGYARSLVFAYGVFKALEWRGLSACA